MRNRSSITKNGCNFKLVARQDIAPSPLHGYYRNDTDLYALDGIRFGKVVEIDDNENPVDMLPQLIDAFKADNPGWLVAVLDSS